MTARRAWRVPALVGPAVLTAGLAAVALLGEHLARAQPNRPEAWTWPDLAAGWSFLLAGLLVLRLRPGNRCWVLLTAVGVAWFAGTFAWAADADVALAGFALTGTSAVLLAWLLLIYPSGRLSGRGEQLLLLALLLLYGVHVASRLFLYVPPDGTGCECVTNRFLPVSDRRWYDAVEAVYPWALAAAFVFVIVSAVTRWRRSSRPGRQVLFPVVASGALLAAELAYGVLRDRVGLVVPTGNDLFFVVAGLRVLTAACFVVGLVQLGATRSAVVDMVGVLHEQGAAPDRLTEALRRALADPSLTLAPWSEQQGAYVGPDGARVVPGAEPVGRATTLISDDERPVAALVHDEALLADPGLVSAVTAAVRLTTDNERLRAEVERQLAEVAASRARIVAAGDAERSRIERDLHDGAQQRLVTIALALPLAESRLPDGAAPAVRQTLGQAVKDLGEAIDELRDLARGIHPAVLSESGLAVALESLADRSPSPVRLQLSAFPEPSASVATAAYFVVSECLTNVSKHAHATGATVRVCTTDGGLLVEVTDDGSGGAVPSRGSGLDGLIDRVAAVGGTLRIDSPAGSGTQVRAWFPCA